MTKTQGEERDDQGQPGETGGLESHERGLIKTVTQRPRQEQASNHFWVERADTEGPVSTAEQI